MKLSERELKMLVKAAGERLAKLADYDCGVEELRLWSDRIATYVADIEALTDG